MMFRGSARPRRYRGALRLGVVRPNEKARRSDGPLWPGALRLGVVRPNEKARRSDGPLWPGALRLSVVRLIESAAGLIAHTGNVRSLAPPLIGPPFRPAFAQPADR